MVSPGCNVTGKPNNPHSAVVIKPPCEFVTLEIVIGSTLVAGLVMTAENEKSPPGSGKVEVLVDFVTVR